MTIYTLSFFLSSFHLISVRLPVVFRLNERSVRLWMGFGAKRVSVPGHSTRCQSGKTLFSEPKYCQVSSGWYWHRKWVPQAAQVLH